MNKICVIVVYYGKFPDFFPIWLESAKKNKDIDFKIFSEQCQSEQYSNIEFIKKDFADLVKHIKSLFKVIPKNMMPYKLCDFRPAYGEIFKDYLHGYEFWGHCDIDLIFGDIRSFLDDELLAKYDKIYSHGHLTLYRNCEMMNSLFKLKTRNTYDYKEVFSNGWAFHFDEYPGISLKAENTGVKVYNSEDFADIDVFHKNFHTIYKGIVDTKPIILKYCAGKLYKIYEDGCEKEIIYAHFQRRLIIYNIQNLEFFLIIPNKLVHAEFITSSFYGDSRKNEKHKEIALQNLKDKLKIDYWKYKIIMLKVKIREIL